MKGHPVINKIKLAKTVVGFVVGAGASKIVAQVIVANTHPEDLKDKILILSGSMAIGGLVADAARNYTDTMIDEIVETYELHVKPRFQK